MPDAVPFAYGLVPHGIVRMQTMATLMHQIGNHAVSFGPGQNGIGREAWQVHANIIAIASNGGGLAAVGRHDHAKAYLSRPLREHFAHGFAGGCYHFDVMGHCAKSSAASRPASVGLAFAGSAAASTGFSARLIAALS